MLVRIAGSAKNCVVVILLAALLACGGGSGTKTLYVVGVGTPEVAQFTVSGSGILTFAKPTSVGAAPLGMVVTPDERYAYVLDSALGSPKGAISQFTVNHSSGLLTAQTESTDVSNTTGTGLPVPPMPVGATPVSIAVDSHSRFVFVANQGDNTISAFTIDRSTGALTEFLRPGCTPSATDSCHFLISNATGPSALAIRGTTLFVANQTGGISVFKFDSNTGALTEVSGSPFAATTNFCSPSTDITTGAFVPCSIDLDPAGTFLYVPNKAANQIVEFSVQSSGALTLVNSFATGTMPVAVRVHRSGKFVYVANWGSNDISGFNTDAKGVLSPILGSPFPSSLPPPGEIIPDNRPSFILADSSGRLLFVTNAGTNTVSAFALDGNTGVLVQATGSPFLAVGSAVGLATIN